MVLEQLKHLSKHMRIGLIGSYAENGGASNLLRHKAQLLVESGIDVTVFHHDRVENPVSGVGSEIIPDPYMLTRVEAGHAIKRILSKDFDLIHFHLITAFQDVSIVEMISKHTSVAITPHSHIFTCPAVKKLRRRPLSPCPKVIGLGCLLSAYRFVCNSRWPWRGVKSYLRCISNLRVAREVDAIIVTSKYMADTLKWVNICSERVHIVPPPVVIESSPVADTSPSDIVLFAGRLDREKGAHCLLEASRRIRSHHRIWIAGDGWQRSMLERQASKQGRDVRFLGWLRETELSSVIVQARVIAMPSLCPETLGLAGLETMAHGKPVVAFNVGGISDWLGDGKNGFLVQPGDIGALAEKLEFLLTQPRLAEEMGRRGREMVKHRFSPERHLNRLSGAYQAAIDVHGVAR